MLLLTVIAYRVVIRSELLVHSYGAESFLKFAKAHEVCPAMSLEAEFKAAFLENHIVELAA